MNNAVALLSVLDTTLRLLERQEVVRRAYQDMRDSLSAMVSENRDPTEAEWAAILNRLAAAQNTLDTRADDARALLANKA